MTTERDAASSESGLSTGALAGGPFTGRSVAPEATGGNAATSARGASHANAETSTNGAPHAAPRSLDARSGHGDAGHAGGAPHALSAALEHELLRFEGGRLHDLHWFRSDWQRGAAATATARYRDDDGTDHAVVVKVPVNQRELRWSRRLGATTGAAEAPVPRLWASGETLGPYDFAWIAVERVQHGPLALHWHATHIQRIADAAARFHRAALDATGTYGVDQAPHDEDWETLLRTAREHVRDPAMPERSRWSTALKELSKKLDKLIDRWRSRRPIGWIHGDLHPANTVSRVAIDSGAACLIDLAEVRAGHWLEDAIYLERLLWTRPDRLAIKPTKALADARKHLGLENGDYPPLAVARRVLLAGTSPAFRGEQGPAFLAASLAKLEEGLHEAR
ncbi:MAG: phosphotransferase [Phycisphaerales bacterium]